MIAQDVICSGQAAPDGWRLLPAPHGVVTPAETVVLVGHGSRDPRSAQTLARLRDRVALLLDQRVELAFLELSEPLLEDVLATLSGRVRIVPLLLGAAFHSRIDLPGRLDAHRATRPAGELTISVGEVLGPHPLLDVAVASQARSLLDRGCDGLVILGTGSSHAPANAEVGALAERMSRALRVPVRTAFVTREPGLVSSATQLRAQGSRAPGLIPWFLAPGLLLDSGLGCAEELGLLVAGSDAGIATLADDPRLARLVVARAMADGPAATAAPVVADGSGGPAPAEPAPVRAAA